MRRPPCGSVVCPVLICCGRGSFSFKHFSRQRSVSGSAGHTWDVPGINPPGVRRVPMTAISIPGPASPCLTARAPHPARQIRLLGFKEPTVQQPCRHDSEGPWPFPGCRGGRFPVAWPGSTVAGLTRGGGDSVPHRTTDAPGGVWVKKVQPSSRASLTKAQENGR